MASLCLTALTGCVNKGISAGDFCDRYVVIDIPREEAKKLKRIYQDRIYVNESAELMLCK